NPSVVFDPHNAEANLTPALFAHCISYIESPMYIASPCLAFNPSKQANKGSGCGLCFLVSLAQIVYSKNELNPNGSNSSINSCFVFEVTIPVLTGLSDNVFITFSKSRKILTSWENSNT